jgi:cell wall-associated NlpC family hydrolase
MALFLRALGPLATTMLCVLAPAAAAADTPPLTGGATFVAEPAPPPASTPGSWTGEEVPGSVAQLLADGTAAAPADAPDQVKQAIWAANWLRDKPYRYGGGHGRLRDTGYDCSGTVSFALAAAGLLETPLDSGSFMSWGAAGAGDWITVYTNPGHAYVVIAGLRLDTSAAGVSRVGRTAASTRESGPRWRPVLRSARGYVRRHPVSF